MIRSIHLPTLLIGVVLLGGLGFGLGGWLGWLVLDSAVQMDPGAAMDSASSAAGDSLGPAAGIAAGGLTLLIDSLFNMGGALVGAFFGGCCGAVLSFLLAVREGHKRTLASIGDPAGSEQV